MYLCLDWGSIFSISSRECGKDNGVIELYQNSVTGLSYNWPLYDRGQTLAGNLLPGSDLKQDAINTNRNENKNENANKIQNTNTN